MPLLFLFFIVAAWVAVITVAALDVGILLVACRVRRVDGTKALTVTFPTTGSLSSLPSTVESEM